MQVSDIRLSAQNPLRVVKEKETQTDISINPKSANVFFSAQNQDVLAQELKKPDVVESTQDLLTRHSNIRAKENKFREVPQKNVCPSSDATIVPKENHSYWKKVTVLVLTFAIALAKLLEPIIRSKFTPEVKT